MIPAFKAIFWDNDGVLVDTEPLFFKATQATLAEAGVTLTRDFFVHEQLKKNTSAFDLARAKGMDEAAIQTLRAERDILYADLLKFHPFLIGGAAETLRALHGKLTMGLVTSSRRTHLDIIMKTAGLLGFFDFVITQEDITRQKPDPEPYLLALQKTGLKPAQCLAVEDSERGLSAAKAAGLTCFVIPHALSAENDFSAADKILRDIRELPALIGF